jgi:tetraacyldisaccharide 4'-kinase
LVREYFYNLATDKEKSVLNIPIKVILFILSLIYALVVRMAIFVNSFKAYRLNCKVISVGNITLGGTGKTTLVEFISRYLKKQGHKVAILSRGYKRRITDYGLRITDYETMGDEPSMLFKNLGNIPVIVDANRIRAAGKAIKEYGVDTVILDDAFQQWRIIKDLEIVAIDATNPFGNRYLLPRGILREPLSSLKRADIFILTKVNLGQNLKETKNLLSQVNPSAPIFAAKHKPMGFYEFYKSRELLKPDTLKGKTVTLFSGIGDPDSFEKLIVGLGMTIGLSFRFFDHHNYTKEDLERIIHASGDKNINTLITTEKDAVRLDNLQFSLSDVRILSLRIELEIEDEQRFYNRLHQLYSL